MSLLQPWWLILLGPWAGLVILALRQYRPKVLVPYLDLWPREEPRDQQKRRGWRPPAFPVAMLLGAMLAGVLALGRPVWEGRRPTLPKMTIIVDRGVTMLAGGRDQRVADRALGILEPLLAEDSEIRVIDTLGGDRLVSRGQLGQVLHQPATPVDTQTRVRVLVRGQRAGGGVTVMLSDHPAVDANVVQIGPENAVRNIGIVRAAVTEKQCLVEVRNDTELTEATVVISGISHRVQLPPRGQARQYTLPADGDGMIHVHLDVADDLADDNDWWILPDKLAPKLVVSPAVSPVVKRFAAAYSATRTKLDGTTVQIVPANEAGADYCIIVAPADRIVNVPALRADHLILRNVRLPEQVLATSASLPVGEWQPILTAGGTVILAADATHRRVWLGMELPEESAEQVLLWTNIVDFVGSGPEAKYAPRMLDATWKREGEELPAEVNGLRAGVYERVGERVAVCVPAPIFPPVRQNVPAEKRLLAMAQQASNVPASPYLWALATAIVAVAAAMAMRYVSTLQPASRKLTGDRRVS